MITTLEKSELEKMTLAELCQHILETHHTFLRENLYPLQSTVVAACKEYQDKKPGMVQLSYLLQALTEDLEHHMMKEERILFPYCMELDTQNSTPMIMCGPGKTVNQPIAVMENDHDHALKMLAQIRELMDDYCIPHWATEHYHVLVDKLMELENDLKLHIHKENEILFPRAIEVAQEKGYL